MNNVVSASIRQNSYTEWLASIPTHWDVVRLRYLANGPLQYGANEAALEDNPDYPRFIRITDINEDGTLRPDTFKSLSPDIAESFLLEEGDILFARSGATVGKAFVYRETWGKACFAGYLIRFRCNFQLLLPDFLFFFTQSHLYWSQVREGSIQATIQNFSAEKYGEIIIPLPLLSEQRAIADYLDSATAKIDALIAAKQRLLHLLAEKRRALITHAVTRGLDATVPQRDSGVEWLGEIPRHWEVMRIKNVAQVGNGSTPRRDNDEYWQNGSFPWLTSTVVNDDIVGEPAHFVTDIALHECHLPLVAPNSVLVAITGEGKTRGMAALLPYQATINQHMAYITPWENTVTHEFVQLFLSGHYDILRMISEGTGSTKGALTCEQISEFPILLPPFEEQQSITAATNLAKCRLDKLVKALEKTIFLLHERRTALIASAVTGKLRVESSCN